MFYFATEKLVAERAEAGRTEPPRSPRTPRYGYRLAALPADLAAAWQLRHRVYCEEYAYLPSDPEHPGLEFDMADAHAEQALVIHEASGMVAATARLILPISTTDHQGLPALRHSAELARSCDPATGLRVAELSRFAVDHRFRRRFELAAYPPDFAPSWADFRPSAERLDLLGGLVLATLAMACRHDVDVIVALADPPLVRLMRRLDVLLVEVGSPVEFHGPRQPIRVDTIEARAGIALHFPEAAQRLAGANRAIPGALQSIW